jgi:hypothetical protein
MFDINFETGPDEFKLKLMLLQREDNLKSKFGGTTLLGFYKP